ncbi:hypothetical protein ABW99_19815 [Pandoraea thiooxydans]|uniref:Uncharacterized protein n=1 Tax=Pandoraea thiooxydans TaxID=445709 RepID=A0A0G3ESS6_9BURK|nr:hypothetical protein [Pandoraea thiooxydans]AKJ70123.1 hypothetical protein ABW99_19815 [Pandoraea thiooxydans]
MRQESRRVAPRGRSAWLWRAGCAIVLSWPAGQVARAGLDFFIPIPVAQCGKALSLQVDPNEARDAEYLGDLDAYQNEEGAYIAQAIADVCGGSPHYRTLMLQRVDRIYIDYAAGQYNPIPYLAGRTLIVATPHDGMFNSHVFRRELRHALERGWPAGAGTERQ